MKQINTTLGVKECPSGHPDTGFALISDEDLSARIAAGEGFTPLPHRVSKGTILERVEAAGKLDLMIALLDAQSPADKMRWDANHWFWSNNPRIRALCSMALDLDPDMILAFDGNV